MCSNGSAHDRHRHRALHAVAPNREVSVGLHRAAVRAADRFGPGPEDQGHRSGVPVPGRAGGRQAGRGQLPASLGGDPIRRPRRRQDLAHLDVVVAGTGQGVLEVVAHGVHRRAAGVGGGDGDRHPPVVLLHVPENPQVGEGEHGQLRVGATAAAIARAVTTWPPDGPAPRSASLPAAGPAPRCAPRHAPVRPPTPVRPRGVRQVQSGGGHDRAEDLIELGSQACRIDTHGRVGEAALDRVAPEQLVDQGPCRVEAGLHPPV